MVEVHLFWLRENNKQGNNNCIMQHEYFIIWDKIYQEKPSREASPASCFSWWHLLIYFLSHHSWWINATKAETHIDTHHTSVFSCDSELDGVEFAEQISYKVTTTESCSMSIIAWVFYYQTMLATPYIISEMDPNHVRYLKLISNLVWINLWFVGHCVQVALQQACCISCRNSLVFIFSM